MPSTLTPHQLSQELRYGTGYELRQRRALVCLSMAAAATLGIVAAYQVGIVRHLPEPHLRGLDSESVSGSDQAYAHLQTPDALLGIASYSGTAILAAAGGEHRARSHPWLPLALAGKVLFDAGNALRMTWKEGFKRRAFCLYCLVATGLTLGMLPLIVPEARHALRHLLGYPEAPRPPVALAARKVRRAVQYPWTRLKQSAARSMDLVHA